MHVFKFGFLTSLIFCITQAKADLGVSSDLTKFNIPLVDEEKVDPVKQRMAAAVEIVKSPRYSLRQRREAATELPVHVNFHPGETISRYQFLLTSQMDPLGRRILMQGLLNSIWFTRLRDKIKNVEPELETLVPFLITLSERTDSAKETELNRQHFNSPLEKYWSNSELALFCLAYLPNEKARDVVKAHFLKENAPLHRASLRAYGWTNSQESDALVLEKLKNPNTPPEIKIELVRSLSFSDRLATFDDLVSVFDHESNPEIQTELLATLHDVLEHLESRFENDPTITKTFTAKLRAVVTNDKIGATVRASYLYGLILQDVGRETTSKPFLNSFTDHEFFEDEVINDSLITESDGVLLLHRRNSKLAASWVTRQRISTLEIEPTRFQNVGETTVVWREARRSGFDGVMDRRQFIAKLSAAREQNDLFKAELDKVNFLNRYPNHAKKIGIAGRNFRFGCQMLLWDDEKGFDYRLFLTPCGFHRVGDFLVFYESQKSRDAVSNANLPLHRNRFIEQLVKQAAEEDPVLLKLALSSSVVADFIKLDHGAMFQSLIEVYTGR